MKSKLITLAIVLGAVVFVIRQWDVAGMRGPDIGLAVHDAVSTIQNTKTQVERFHYDQQKLPASNRDLGLPPPQHFVQKSALLRDVEVLQNGVVFVRMKAMNRDRPVELVLTPKEKNQYQLDWTCESYNITREWRQALMDLCTDAPQPFDRDAWVQQHDETYLARVVQEQRKQQETSVKLIERNCEAMAAAPDTFVQITDTAVRVWLLQDVPQKLFATSRPAGLNAYTHAGFGENLYLYAENRMLSATRAKPDFFSSAVYLFNPTRLRRAGELLWANTGAGLSSIDTCAGYPELKTQYLFELGAFNQITDFQLYDNLALLTVSEASGAGNSSALQVVVLQPNRALGFLKLEGNARGVVMRDRYAYVANGSWGIAVVDVFDKTLPRLLKRVTTQDAAMDILLQDDYLLVADRMAGFSLFALRDNEPVLLENTPTTAPLAKLVPLQNGYISAISQNGTTSLWRWRDKKLQPVTLP